MNNTYIKLEKSRNDVIKHEYAYVWLIMLGDSYLPGVFASVWSIKRTNTKYNTVVMVTNDVSIEIINILKKIADYVVIVDYLEYKTVEFKSGRQKELYSSWINKSFTKWQCLRLPFNKVLFLDADTVTFDNIDHLFKLNAPAGNLNNYAMKPIGYLKNPYLQHLQKTNQLDKIGKDGFIKHNVYFPPKLVEYMFKKGNSMSVIGTTILLKPNINDYNNLVNMLEKKRFTNVLNVYSGSDEQSIMYYYSIYNNGPKVGWHSIHHRYNSVGFWTKGLFDENDKMIILHLFSDSKPWNMPVNGIKTYKNNKNIIVTEEFEDIVVWWQIFLDGLSKLKLSSKFKIFNTYYKDDLKLCKENVKNNPNMFIKKYFSDKLKDSSIKTGLDLLGKLIPKEDILLK